MDYLPWWSMALLACLFLHHPGKIFDDFDHNSLLGDSSAQPGRRLQSAQGGAQEQEEENELNITLPALNITIPCVSLPFIGDAFKPCGNVSVGPHGLDIETPFGTKHIPGSDMLEPYVHELDRTFSHYTKYIVGASVAFYAILTALSKSRRDAVITHFKSVFAGELDPEADPPTAEEIEERKSPDSANFIAPGNIYRLLAVLHPGIIGMSAWMGYASKALICAYMQLYIPISMISNTFKQWTFIGVKTPLWFLTNGTTFVLMFASVGSVCQLFASKCSENIRRGAEANFHILTHQEPSKAGEEASASGSNKSTPLLPNVSAKGDTEAVAHNAIGWLERKYPKSVPKFINANQYFWCCLSMCLNTVMSILLFLAMFLKIATFTGQIADVALVAVALYFVFDLDDKVMDSDPNLRPRYRKAVLAETEELTYKPIWLKAIAGMFKTFVSALTPLGLVAIFLCACKSDHVVIGGDPF